MRHSESISNIFSALVRAQKELGAVGKSERSDHGKYKYATLADYRNEVKPILDKYDLALIEGVTSVTEMAPTKTMLRVSVALECRLIHSSGEWIETSCVGEGADSTDKSTYKAITGARKYAYASLFNLVTTDDPEAVNDDEKPKRPKADMSKASSLEHVEGVAVTNVTSAKKSIKGRDVIVYNIHTSDGAVYSTTKKDTADRANEYQQTGENVLVEFQQTEYGLALLSIGVV